MGWIPDNSGSNLKGGTTRGGRSHPDEPDIRPLQIYCELNTCL